MIATRRFQRVGAIAGKPAKGDVDEEVNFILLNIFMAFTISLGFFLTEGTSAQSALEQEVKAARFQAEKAGDRAERLAGVVKHLGGTTVGKEARKAAEHQRLAQRNQLLSAWYQLRPSRELYQHLKEVQNVKRIPLARELNYLPKDPSYTQLTAEVKRVFLEARGPDRVERRIVAGLLSEVCTRALNLKKQEMQSASTRNALAVAIGRAFATGLEQRVSPPYAGLTLDSKTPHPANLDYVAQTIRKDIEEERADVARAQTELVDFICEERIRARSFREGSKDRPDNSAEALRVLVAELEQELCLLPEVVNQYH
jgi:hypothetical protein